MPVPTLANVAHPRGQGYAVALGSDLFRGAFGPGRELQLETAPFEAQPLDTRTNPEEMIEGSGRMFARDDFTGGEGLDFAHTRAERVNKDSRYFDSVDVDPSPSLAGETREVTLLPGGQKVLTAPPSAGITFRMAWQGTHLYVTDYNQLASSTNPTAAVPTFVGVDPHAGEVATTVRDVAALGTYTYAALGVNGIHRSNAGGAWAHWSDIQATRVWNAKSRIIAAAGTSLYEAAAGAAPTPLYTLPTGATWNDVVDAGDAILAAASDGNIYAFAPDTTTGALRLYAQTPVEGEEPTAVGYGQGIVFYGTREPNGTGYNGRWWRAELSEALTLVNGQLLREWRSTTCDRGPRTIQATRDAVYTGVSNEVAGNDSPANNAYLWKYDLQTGGVYRWHYLTTAFTGHGSTIVRSIVPVAGQLYRSFDNGFELAAARAHPTQLRPNGYLIGPLGDFFTSAVKSWVGAHLDADVPIETVVRLYYSTDPAALASVNHASWTEISTWTNPSSVTSNEIPLTGAESRYIAGKVVIEANPALTVSPVFRSFGFRGLPGGGGGSANVDQQINIPVNVSDQLERPNKRRLTVRGLGRRDYNRLRALQGEALTLTLYLLGGAVRYRGLVESVGAPMQNPERGSASVYAMVRFRGREVTP